MAEIRKQYDNADIVITLLGSQPLNFAGIEYADTVENQTNNGRGGNIVGYSEGKKSFTGTLSLGKEEVDQIQAVAPSKDLKRLKPFTIVVSYINEDQGITNDVLVAKFTGKTTASKSGDMNLVHDLVLLVLDIKYDVSL